jgi:hypothetical protein
MFAKLGESLKWWFVPRSQTMARTSHRQFKAKKRDAFEVSNAYISCGAFYVMSEA